MKFNLNTLLAITLLILGINKSHSQDWSFQFEPYIQATNIEGDTSVGRVTGGDVDVDFDDILETLDIGAMVRFEAHHKSGWGVMLDYAFMDLKDDISGARGGTLEAGVRQGVFEALVARRFELETSRIDYFTGIRWWDNDVDITVDLAALPGSLEAEIEEDWVDLVVGARWYKQLRQNWALHLRGDIGGFGLESDFTSALVVGLHYQMTERMILDLTYKGVWVDYEDGNRGQPGYFQYDTVTHGPIVGVIFNF